MVTRGVERGRAAQAQAWIAASKLGAADKKALAAFVDRFPTLTFFRELPESLARNEAESTVAYPAWLKAIRGTLAGIHAKPGRVSVRFDAFDLDDSPRADRVAETDYVVERPVFAHDQERQLLGETCTSLPFARDHHTGHSTLCFGLDKTNKTEIYECAEEDLWDAEADGKDPNASFYKAFKSYRSMLDHIAVIEVDGVAVRPVKAR